MYKLNGGFTQHHFCMYNELKKRAGFSEYKSGAGFTLLELLVTIAIISVVMTAVVLVINPIETLSQARDGRRISEVTSIDEAITLALQQSPALFEGDPNTIYLSLPDSNSNCSSYSSILPPLVLPWKYNCVSQANLFKTDGNGWLPFNFDSLTIRPMSTLPVDPVNEAVKKGLYYNYVPGWEIDAQMESHKYEWGGSDDRESLDGGNTIVLYEKGENLNVAPKEVNARITYESKADTACLNSFGPDNGFEWYPKFTVGLGLSGPAVVTKLLYWSPDVSLDSSKFLNMTIYRSGSPDYGRITYEDLSLYGMGQMGWSSSTFNSPVPIQLGQNYFFAIAKGMPDPYKIADDGTGNCSGYPPLGTNNTHRSANDGKPNATVPIPGFPLNAHVGFVGVVYAKN